ncbi:PAS domain S-box protein [Rubrolithibacter danxiaensis]|uniref:PAS domain S-box protein n=1 Tax=Rubrolithibacter danxiaensis TaxID=3390805 RepID=UPI003BF91998
MYNLEELLSAVNDAVWSYDLQARKFLYTNSKLIEIYEDKLDQLTENPLSTDTIVHPDDAEFVKQEFESLYSGKQIEIEYRIVVNQQVKWLCDKKVIKPDENKQGAMLISIISDVTRRKESELNLKKSERTYRYLFERSPIPSWIYDRETYQFLAVNEAAVKKYGYSKKEFLQMTILDIRSDDEKMRLLARIGKDNALYNSSKHWKHFKKDGGVIYVNVAGHYVLYKGRDAEMVMVNDITSEIENKEEIIVAKSNLDALINNTNDLIWSIDKDYKIISANTAFSNYYKFISSHDLNKGDSVFVDGFPDKIKYHWKKYYDKAFKGAAFTISEKVNYRNFPMTVEVRYNPIYNAKGEIIGVGCFSRDITERVEAEEKILNQNTQLMEIASYASHDIRGPVASILGMVNLFNTNNFADPFNVKLIEGLKESAQKLDEVIHIMVQKTYNMEENEGFIDSSQQSQSGNV